MRKVIKYLFRLLFIPLEWMLIFIFILFIYILFNSSVAPPEVPNIQIGERIKVGDNHYTVGPNYLKKNAFGIWEMYIEGKPYERGLIYGELAKELNQEQEEIFVEQINQFVPPGFYQNFLKVMMGFFTNSIPDYIPLENQQEIYGISQTFADEFDFIAPKYTRILGYHAAHDFGHALNDYSLVGCTSFALKGNKTFNHGLMLGRNFDFYVGDEFAKNKLILLINPEEGYQFISYSWPGFTGVASGMNEKGLTVTINASKSTVPTSAKMPISILARVILQYAKNTKEAIEIAKKSETFVSETLMIGSAADGTTILIEKSPDQLGVYEMNNNQLICSNHYQSKTFSKDSINILNIQNSDSKFRFNRVEELINQKNGTFTPLDVAKILRNQKAHNGDTLGMGNPRAINQLIAHHSVIMQPRERKFYISTTDFQLGKYIGYDLTQTFAKKRGIITDTIPEDPFVNTKAYQQFLDFKQTKFAIKNFLMFDQPLDLSQQQIQQFISNNGESFITYQLLGNYYKKKGQNKIAIPYFKKALNKNTASKNSDLELQELIKSCQEN